MTKELVNSTSKNEVLIYLSKDINIRKITGTKVIRFYNFFVRMIFNNIFVCIAKYVVGVLCVGERFWLVCLLRRLLSPKG